MSGLLKINVSPFSPVIALQNEILDGRGDITYQEIYNVLQCEEWRNVGDNRNNKSDIKVVTFTIFCLLSSYVLLFGKEKTGIKIDYAFTSAILIGVMVIL